MPGVVAEALQKARKPTKNEQRRAKKRQQKLREAATPAPVTPVHTGDKPASEDIEPEIDVDELLDPSQSGPGETLTDASATSSFEIAPDNSLAEQFTEVFAKFAAEDGGNENKEATPEEPDKPEVFYDDDDNIQGEDEELRAPKRMSKKARKALNKLSTAELKALVRKPENVEWTDTDAHDPKLLVSIKSTRNVVPVPSHWSLKREYLSNKRGVEKAGFALPQFIAETGISEMRDAVLEKQAEASLKQRQRERVQPKMGKLDIDYQKLYEAFFRRQTKPELTRYGEVYYEGKEYETNLRHLRPGDLSEELQEALNMPPGAPPPWLINQQRVGPPPSYPALKIPGLNAPPPLGASWGYHPGGFGKPPLDEQNKPLWGGDIFGLAHTEGEKETEKAKPEPIDRTLWGELQPLEEEGQNEEEEEEEEDEDEGGDEESRDENLTTYGGIETPGGITSTVPSDFGTQTFAEEFNLRKQRRGTETESSQHPRSAGQVLKERSIRAEGFFGGDRAYDLDGTRGATSNNNGPVLGEHQEQRGNKRKVGDLDVSVDVDTLEREGRLSKDQVSKQYEAQRQQEQAGGWRGAAVDNDDLSEMIAEESAKRRKKDQEYARRRGR